MSENNKILKSQNIVNDVASTIKAMTSGATAANALISDLNSKTTIALKSLQPIFDLQEVVAKAIKPMVEINELIVKPLEQVREQLKLITSTIDFSKLINIGQSLIDEGIRIDALMKSGWWYCPSMLKIDSTELKNAADEYHKKNRKIMSSFFKKKYQENDFILLRSTVKSWENNVFFKNRMKIIYDALDAHINNKYTLSIPALLPLAEGIATDYCKKNNLSLNGVRSKGGKKIEKALSDFLVKNGYPYKFPDMFLEAIQDVIYNDTRCISDPFQKKLNRHGVLHGGYTKYYDNPRSLRCFLLLDAISVLN